MTSVTISEGVTSIGYNVFEGCSSLTSLTILCPQVCEWFSGNTSIKELILGDKVTEISYYAFRGCSGLTSVTILCPYVGDWFAGNTYINELILGDKVTSISSYAFRNCTGLTSVTIPNSVTSIGGGAFSGCSGLTEPIYSSNIFVYMPSSYEGSYAIPEGITTIGADAFQGCSGLTSVTIPEGVTEIGYRSFEYCSSLTSVTIPNSVTSIGEDAFRNCTGLTSVTIPNSVTSIGDDAFSACDGLTSIVVDENNSVYDSRENCNAIIETSTNTLIQGCSNTIIPNDITSISGHAFRNCSSLTSITIPSSVTSIGSFAFDGCSGLTSVKVNWNRPLTRSYNIFGADYTSEYSVFNIATLYVPKGTVMMYMTADEWSNFANILEFEDGEDVHYITIRMGDGGVLKQSVDVGKTYTYTVCADEGWEVNTLTFDGKDMTSLLMDDQFSTPVITGNSELNVVFKQNETGLKKVMSHSDVKVYASNKNITVTGADMNAKVDVYSINGAFVTSAFGNTTIPLEHGVYIVKVGQESFKVRL